MLIKLFESLKRNGWNGQRLSDLRKVEGTTDVIEEIGKASINAARLVHDYLAPSIWGNVKFAGQSCGLFLVRSYLVLNATRHISTHCRAYTIR